MAERRDLHLGLIPMSSLFITLQNSPGWAPSEFNILELVVPRTKNHSDSNSYYVLHTYMCQDLYVMQSCHVQLHR